MLQRATPSSAAQKQVKLTSLSSCAGCAAKLSQSLLREVLKPIALEGDPNLLVGAGTADDAGIYRLDARRALVQTVDFFTPIVDDGFDYGQIAATNAISDVYAMGGKPLTAMNLLGVPVDRVSTKVIRRILLGGASKAREAGVALVGGHTIKTQEPIYGLSVTGLVDPRRIMTNASARPGDLLLLTKPLGTGIATTAIKRGLCSARLARRATALMCTLNRVGHELGSSGLVKAATDVTGFGLLGHLVSMVKASGVMAEIVAADVPAISPEIFDLIAQDCVPGGSKSNVDSVAPWTAFAAPVSPVHRVLLCDAQTSGGLLLCVPPRRLAQVLAILREFETPLAATIGKIGKGKPHVAVR